jgi:hypothetical protein
LVCSCVPWEKRRYKISIALLRAGKTPNYRYSHVFISSIGFPTIRCRNVGLYTHLGESHENRYSERHFDAEMSETP